jgi:hypothetical protein
LIEHFLSKAELRSEAYDWIMLSLRSRRTPCGDLTAKPTSSDAPQSKGRSGKEAVEDATTAEVILELPF